MFFQVQSSDATVEALAIKGTAQERLFIATDEASIVESIIVGRYSEGFTNEGFFCKIYSVSPYERERVRESIYAPAICGSMLLMGQPHITKKMFQNEKMRVSGFIPRFLFASVKAEIQKENREARKLKNEHRDNYNELILRLLREFWPLTGEAALIIGMEESAKTALSDYYDSYVDRANGILANVDAVVLRLKEQATRLAVVIHAAKLAEGVVTEMKSVEQPINLRTVQSAIALVNWSFNQYMNYNSAAHEEELNAIELEVLTYIKVSGKTVTPNDICKRFQAVIVNAAQAESFLESLFRKNKIQRRPDVPGKKGGRPTKKYEAKK